VTWARWEVRSSESEGEEEEEPKKREVDFVEACFSRESRTV
jgi:hypothetical protein